MPAENGGIETSHSHSSPCKPSPVKIRTEALKNNLSESNPYRLGQAIGVNNFGMLTIDWDKRKLDFLFYDNKGNQLFSHAVTLTD